MSDVHPKLNFFSPETLEGFKKFSTEEKLLRIVDVNAAANMLLTASMLRKQNRITNEQFNEVEKQVIILVEAVSQSPEMYNKIYEETGLAIKAVLGIKEEISAEQRAKMN